MVFRHACAMGLEGIVSKRLGSRYVSGRSRDWLKFKNPDAPAVKREAEGGLGAGMNARADDPILYAKHLFFVAISAPQGTRTVPIALGPTGLSSPIDEDRPDFTSSRLLKNWAARLTLEHEFDSCAVEKAAGGIHARFGYTDR